jgi:inositol-phosphate transport system ATP-binding protein
MINRTPVRDRLGALGLPPEHLRFTSAGLSGRIAQTEPMGREILYVVETDIGYLRVLEHGSVAVHRVDEPVIIGFSPEDTLVFDTPSERLIAAARVSPPA